MEYKCKTLNINQLNVGPQGFIMPLCEDCCTRDCTNPIESISISIMGVTRKVKVYNRGNTPQFVVECEGYIPNV